MSLAEGFNEITTEQNAPLVRLDLGCGGNPHCDRDAKGRKLEPDEDGYKGEWIGVDCIAFDGVDQVVNLANRQTEWQEVADSYGMSHASLVHVGYEAWPWEDDSVDEINAAHFLEHFDEPDRTHILNEMYRVLKPGCKATVVVPAWTSARAYGDPTHVGRPHGMYGCWYWNREWRMGGMKDGEGKGITPQAPHTDASNIKFGYDCDFEFTVVGGMHPSIVNYPQERQMHMMEFNIEAVLDLHITLLKRKKSW